MRSFLLFFLLLSSFSIYLDASKTSTLPSPLEDQGYLYLTFCSYKSESLTLKFYPQSFEITPTSTTISFSGTSTNPDCVQLVFFVKSPEPGMKTLVVEGNSKEWIIPVVFEKKEPLIVSISKDVLYTGYDTAKLYISGSGEDVWVTLNASVVGSNVLYSPALPSSFYITFYFPSSGYYSIPLTVKYRRGNSSITQVYYLGLRVEEPPIEIKGSSKVPAQGYGNLSFFISAPEKLYSARISLISDCLEGEKEKFFREFKEGNVSFKVKGVCDPGIYNLIVMVGNYQRSIPLEIYGPSGFEVMVSPSLEKNKLNFEVTIANIGSEVMKATSVKLLEGNYEIVDEGTFLGDLEPGDFDSADLVLIPHGENIEINYQISFTRAGKRVVINKTSEFRFKKKGNFLVLFPILLIPVIYYAKARKSSS